MISKKEQKGGCRAVMKKYNLIKKTLWVNENFFVEYSPCIKTMMSYYGITIGVEFISKAYLLENNKIILENSNGKFVSMEEQERALECFISRCPKASILKQILNSIKENFGINQ